jgi:hypothetical protein
VGFDQLRRGPARGRRGLPQAQGVLKKEGLATSVGDEGGFAPNLKNNEGGPRARGRPRTAAGYKPGDDRSCSRSTSPRASSTTRTAPTAGTARTLDAAELVALLRRPGAPRVPALSIEDGAAEDDWDGWKLLTERSAARCSSSATTSSSPTPSASRAASSEGSPTRSSSSSTRSAPSPRRSRPSIAHRARATPASCRTARARPRTPSSPTSPSPPTPARSRPARLPRRARREVQPAPAHRGRARRRRHDGRRPRPDPLRERAPGLPPR